MLIDATASASRRKSKKRVEHVKNCPNALDRGAQNENVLRPILVIAFRWPEFWWVFHAQIDRRALLIAPGPGNLTQIGGLDHVQALGEFEGRTDAPASCRAYFGIEIGGTADDFQFLFRETTGKARSRSLARVAYRECLPLRRAQISSVLAGAERSFTFVVSTPAAVFFPGTLRDASEVFGRVSRWRLVTVETPRWTCRSRQRSVTIVI